MNEIRRGWMVAACLLAAGVAAEGGVAGIEAYNDAVRRGDLAAATDAAVTIWPQVAGDAVNARRLAREFGFAACRAGRLDDARRFAELLAGNPAALPGFDDEPEASRVLLRLVQWKQQPAAPERDALFEALATRVAADATSDEVSVYAARELLVAMSSADDWSRAARAAGLLSRLAGRAGEARLVLRREAEVQQIAATFMVERSARQYQSMADLYDRLVTDVERAPDHAQRSALDAVRHRARAWTRAIGAYLTGETATGPGLTRLPAAQPDEPFLKPGFRQPVVAAASGPAGNPVKPRCDGALSHVPPIEYPLGERKRDMVGAVVISVRLDEEGRVSNPRLLAAVPSESLAGFADQVLATVSQWRFVPAADADRAGCRIEGDDYTVDFVFVLR